MTQPNRFGRRSQFVLGAAAFLVLAGIFVGWILAKRHPAPLPDNAAEFLQRREVRSSIVTFAPLLDDLAVLRGDGDIDFTALSEEQWAVLLHNKGKSDARSAQ